MIFGALVVLLIILTLAILIIPLLKKPSFDDALNREQQNIEIAQEKKIQLQEQLSQQQMTEQEYDAAISDLENSLAIDLERQQALDSNQEAGTWVAWLFAISVPVLSVYLYLQLGEYRVIENPALAQARSASQSQGAHSDGKTPTMAELVEKLKDHLRGSPDDARGWFMLGRTMMTLQNYTEAVVAFERSYDLNDNEPNVILALADSLAMINDGKMTGQPEQLVLKALEISPEEQTGLWLAGLAAEQGGRNREAYDYWMKLLPLLNDDPASADEVKTLLAALKQKNPELPELNFATAKQSQGLSVAVTLDQQFTNQVNPNDLVFIYAKASAGPPMPLAAKRLKVSDLPVQVVLSDNDAMMPQMKMSGFDQIIIGARISKSGNPIAQSGDLFDESNVIEHKTYDGLVEININQVK
jgi:cytochrome c-type biogenesis protein CcmH